MVSPRAFGRPGLMTGLLAGWLIALGSLSPSASAARLSGRVVDSQEQRIYGHATLQAAGGQTTRSDDAGYFQLDDLPAGPNLLTVALANGEGFRVRLQVPDRPRIYLELDRARHRPPEDEDEY
ncbi:MAG: carboxypeptidase-like regulatory domain-containing protein [Zoogloea sp.]|uniref:carboxypeptidase-like regulatory domain-containing protein n=1 Tax=Zoogloea sp. TaxID=49181 RepID=UPI003F33ADD2